MSPVEFRILGPLAVRAGPDRLELGGARQQVALAVLLLNANHVVSVGRLLEAVYGEEPPPTARAQTQITISALRRLLAAPGQDGIISTRGQGYAIEAGGGRVRRHGRPAVPGAGAGPGAGRAGAIGGRRRADSGLAEPTSIAHRKGDGAMLMVLPRRIKVAVAGAAKAVGAAVRKSLADLAEAMWLVVSLGLWLHGARRAPGGRR
jgi:Transcriptional regulatory protein, C terminal